MTERLPDDTRSYWLASTADAEPPAAPSSLPEVDVVVLGAGIAGLTTAYLLAQHGQRVAVVEAGQLAAGTSGYTTAKVTAQHGLVYGRLRARYGEETARAYGRSQLAALDWLRSAVLTVGADCDFAERDSYVYATGEDRRAELRREAGVAASLGLPASYTEELDLPYPVAGAVRFTGQAQFHPRRWLLAVANRIAGLDGLLLTGVRALGVREGDPCEVTTTVGPIRGRDVVVATHYPIFDRGLYFARLHPTREVVVAGPVEADRAPAAMYLGTDDRHSVRCAPLDDGRQLLIVGGATTAPASGPTSPRGTRSWPAGRARSSG